MLTAVAVTRLEKAATDNGFDLERERTVDWLSFGSSQTPMRIWLAVVGASRFLAAASRADVIDGLAGPRRAERRPAPERRRRRTGRRRHRRTASPAAARVPALAGRSPTRCSTSSRTPRRACHGRRKRSAGSCSESVRTCSAADSSSTGTAAAAITGLDVPDLLRASHVKPWADCATDAERLDVYNGLLLAPHVDAAFDAGFITISADGTVLVSDALSSGARSSLGLDRRLRVHGLHRAHERYLPWHRTRIFRRGAKQRGEIDEQFRKAYAGHADEMLAEISDLMDAPGMASRVNRGAIRRLHRPHRERPGAARRSRPRRPAILRVMTLADYKIVLYRQIDGAWVAEVPAIGGCYALMDTREAALTELHRVFQLIVEEHEERGQGLPEDTTQIMHA